MKPRGTVPQGMRCRRPGGPLPPSGRHHVLLSALLFCGVLLGGASAQEPKLSAAEQAALDSNPTLKEQYLHLARAQQMLLAEARKAKWDERPEVQAAIARARDKALAESWLESVATPPPDYPSEAELKSAWEERRASFATPRQHRLAQIYIACPKGADKATVAKAEAKLAAVKKRLASADEDFASVARTASEDKASSPAGGEIGWLSDAQIQPELRAPVVRLLKHEISTPLRLNDGWHILKCLDRRDAHAPTLEECRAALTQQLRAEKTRSNSEAYVAKLLRGGPDSPGETAQTQGNSPPPN